MAIGLMLLRCHADTTFVGHVAEVEDGIAHATKGGIDAAVGLLGYFLEGELVVHTHHQYFTL